MLQSAIDDLTQRGAERGVDLRPGLSLIEERLQTTVASDLPFLDEASRYLIDAGGKRFRPMLVLLTGMLTGAPSSHPALVDAGVIVELVHLSTLYHDDVIDTADVRRGAPSAHVKWSNTVAILTGDFLLARASELSAALGVEVTRVMARTIADLCQGQIREVQGSAAGQQRIPGVVADRDHYLRVIGEKTASLIGSSCRLGAILTDQGADATEAVTRYGWHLGMSFQLADDVLDITSSSSESGKTPGTDLREGVRSLPVLLALDAEGPDSRLAKLLDEPSDGAVAEALACLREHPALELARDAARMEATKAKHALDSLPQSLVPAAAVEGLAYLADYAADRVG
ncbi:MAG: polyprenyl synthetase family protein [Nitriliruptorales bacterium]|nr:polyprenyl synthetase family protein [Nitriliruptorales bacterium]